MTYFKYTTHYIYIHVYLYIHMYTTLTQRVCSRGSIVLSLRDFLACEQALHKSISSRRMVGGVAWKLLSEKVGRLAVRKGGCDNLEGDAIT